MKLKFLRTLIINSLVTAIVGVFFVLGGCSKADDPVQKPDPTQTIMEIVAANPDLSELAGYLDKFPDLQGLLSASGTYTLFAPTNAAFTTLYSFPGFPEDPANISLNVIKGVIAYHIIASKLLKADLIPTGTGAGLATLFDNPDPCTGAKTNQVIKINDDGTLLTGSQTNNIMIETADLEATNGVVHKTATVLIPPSVGIALTATLGKLLGTVLLGADFTYLAQVITKADCGVLSGETPIQSILGNPDAKYTAFLPPNLVFEGTATTLGKADVQALIDTFSPAEWRSIILNHISSGSTALSDLTDGADVFTFLGAPANPAKLTVSMGTVGAPPASPLGKYLMTSGGTTGINGGAGTAQAPIYQGDLNADNGVAHVVGKILFPN